MHNTPLSILKSVGALLLVSASCLLAQSGRSVVAKIPFDFTVHNQDFVAGRYTVRIDLAASTALIRSEADNAAAFALIMAGPIGRTEAHGKLVFNRYGDRYFLSQVWIPTSDQARELVRSSKELELAKNWGKPEIVALVAKAPGH